jgi:hypothetical protein
MHKHKALSSNPSTAKPEKKKKTPSTPKKEQHFGRTEQKGLRSISGMNFRGTGERLGLGFGSKRERERERASLRPSGFVLKLKDIVGVDRP